MFKKAFLILFILLIGILSYEYLSLPFAEIRALKNGYPQLSRMANNPDIKNLKIVKKKPAHWRKLSTISREAYWAIVISEDWSFYEHDGYDPAQLEQAIDQAIEGERVRGASTITQQVIKNLFFSNEKSYIRKMRELYLAKVLDEELSKDQILEIYLNIIEFGENLYGISDASRFYFSKEAFELNAAEGAFLAMLLPSPIRYGESFRKKKMTKFAQEIVNSILHKLVVAKIIDEVRRDEMLNYKFGFIMDEEAEKEEPDDIDLMNELNQVQPI